MVNKNTLLVNIFAGPGVGKSTFMAGLFYELKMYGVECEMAPEYVKDKIWEGSTKILDNQLYVTANQYHRLFRLSGKVDVIVTDSPLLLGLYYGQKESAPYKDMVLDLHNKFDSINIVLDRIHRYSVNGRMQSHVEAITIDEKINKIVNTYCYNIYRIKPERESVNEIKELIISKI